MTARQHHYVPQCYLKGFTKDRENPKLFVIDFKKNLCFDTSPANVAVERDFHRVDIDDVSIDTVENLLAEFESELSPALERIIAARSIDDDNDRGILLNFICMMAVKRPRLRKSLLSAIAQAHNCILSLKTPRDLEAAFWEDEENGSPKFGDKGQYRIKLDNTAQLEREMKLFEICFPHISSRRWLLIKAPPGETGFVTSDHPFCLIWSDPNRQGNYSPPGLGHKGTRIIFPISNELAVIGAYEIDDGEVDADDLAIAQINACIINNCTRQIYARGDDFKNMMPDQLEIKP